MGGCGLTSGARAKADYAYTRDVGKSIARVDPLVAKRLGLDFFDALVACGKTRTAARYLPLYPSDESKGIVRVDGLIRLNLGITVGDEVEVAKAEPMAAERLVLMPLEFKTSLLDDIIDEASSTGRREVTSWYLTEALLGRPLMSGDLVGVPYMENRFSLLVLEKEPSAEVSVVTSKTQVELVPPLAT